MQLLEQVYPAPKHVLHHDNLALLQGADGRCNIDSARKRPDLNLKRDRLGFIYFKVRAQGARGHREQ